MWLCKEENQKCTAECTPFWFLFPGEQSHREVGQHGPTCRLCPLLFCFKCGEEHGANDLSTNVCCCLQLRGKCLPFSSFSQEAVSLSVVALTWSGLPQAFLEFNHPLLYTVAISIVAVIVCFIQFISVFLSKLLSQLIISASLSLSHGRSVGQGKWLQPLVA